MFSCDSTPRSVCLSLSWLVGWSITFYFLLCFCGLWLHCSCPIALATTNTVFAHPHVTGEAVYSALFHFIRPCSFTFLFVYFLYSRLFLYVFLLLLLSLLLLLHFPASPLFSSIQNHLQSSYIMATLQFSSSLPFGSENIYSTTVVDV